ncbi:MAG: CMP-N-acetylneuraminic acid synthetase [Flavobacteriaceae bacterium]|jgi:CMP-N-acetylneuraminic acid synthetase|nr:CMP-N-acetylneuraminic acid synthetase [Flavobacteriaceae bacterium]
MKVVSLIIGRGNNTLKNKNILPVLGKPLLQWGALAAKNSKYVNAFYISSDDDKILNAGKEVGFIPVKRPDELALPTSQSSDAVKHALEIIENDIGEIDIMIVIHANVGTISSRMIDDCIDILLEKKCSSVIPSHYKYEYHPRRAKKIMPDGTLQNFLGKEGEYISANRQDLEPCVFFDHSFWVLDVSKGIKSSKGQYPWPVMGNNIIPYITEGCFDVHDMSDLGLTEEWLKKNNVRYE